MPRGSNSSSLREYNVRVLLTALQRAKVASKAELARGSQLTLQAVTRIVDKLEDENLIIRVGRRSGGKGQPATLYSISSNGAFSIGVKIGRHNMQLLLINFDSEILGRHSFDYDYPKPSEILNQLENGLSMLTSLLSVSMQSRLTGVGVAMPWFIDAWKAKTGMSDRVAKEWAEMNFSQEIMALIDLPVFFENDCSAAAIAELQLGNGNTASDFLYIHIGNFIGGGVILHGSLESGNHGNAGALASMPVPRSNLPNNDPSVPKYENLNNRSSISSLLAYLQKAGHTINSLQDLENVLHEQNSQNVVAEWLVDSSSALAFAILSSVSVLDFEIVVIESALPKGLTQRLIELTTHEFEKIASNEIFIPKIMLGSLGEDAIALGGAMLPFYSTYAPNKQVLSTAIQS